MYQKLRNKDKHLLSGIKGVLLISYNSQTRCEVGTVGKISDCQPEGPGFNPRPGRGIFEQLLRIL